MIALVEVSVVRAIVVRTNAPVEAIINNGDIVAFAKAIATMLIRPDQTDKADYLC